MSNFVHLHNHTDFSLLDGAATISGYISKASECGMKHLAITDHGNMYGAIYFYDACRAAGINPLVGCEFYMHGPDRRSREPGTKNNHLILIAMSDKGYHNLMELNAIAFKEGFYYKPRIDDESLAAHSEDVICCSACIAGEIIQQLLQPQQRGGFIQPTAEQEKKNMAAAKKRIEWFKSVFGDRYYIELQDHGLPEQKYTNPLLVQLAHETDTPLICTNDIHYLNKEDANAQDTLLCIGTGAKKHEENRMKFPCAEFYFKTPEQMTELFSWCPEAVENTVKLAERCHLEINFPGPILPQCQIPEPFTTEAEYLVYLANEGLRERYDEITPILQARLDYELGVIIKMDFPGYFLIVRDYIHWAKMHDIPVGPGRGSGAGSLVAYCTTITDVEPMKYNLLFERFLNIERVSMPDFDVDFCFERRGEVIDYVTDHYGKDRVGQIVTFGTLKTKAVVKDVSRVLDIAYDEVNKICALVPDEPKMTIQKALDMEPRLKEYQDRGGVYKELFETAKKLEGLHRHTSLHAAGVVIGREPLDHYVPLMCDPKTGGVATQYTMKQIENCGLVKMDFLGLKTLTLIKHTVDLIRKRVPDFDINKIDELDKPTFKMLCDGDSSLVFQFESPGMRRILRRAQPGNIEDLVALNALYRPGPMQFIDQYIDSKLGKIPINYPDPDLEPVLKTTYGVIVYQEQVMQVAQIIAGYSLGQADILRRIMGKKQADKLAAELVNFRAGAVKRGYTAEHAEEIFHILEPFAGYGFNKSHAVAYSVVAYQTAFLKANYPAEFLAANLTNEMNNPAKFTEYLNLAPEMNLRIVAPDINRSDVHFGVSRGDIVYGLSGIKNVGEAACVPIVKEREEHGPYKSFMDFLARSKDSPNSRMLESLIKAGAFDCLGENRATLFANLEAAIQYDKASRALTANGQISLFGEEDTAMNAFNMRPVDDWSQEDKLAFEKELLGFYISGHPLDVWQEKIDECVRVKLDQPEDIPIGRPVSLIAMVIDQRVVKTKKGDKMGIYTLQTKEGETDAVMFPKLFAQFGQDMETDGIYGFRGSFNKRGEGEMSFAIDEVLNPAALTPDLVKSVTIVLRESKAKDDSLIEELSEVLQTGKGNGDIPVRIECPWLRLGLKLNYDWQIGYDTDFIKELKGLEVVDSVIIY